MTGGLKMVRTLYYAITIRYIGLMANEGFIIVKLKDDEIKSIEGVLTNDYLEAEFNNDLILLNYYSRENDIGKYQMEFSIELDSNDIELPLSVSADTDFTEIKINTEYRIVKFNEVSKCNRILKEFKNNVFGEERG